MREVTERVSMISMIPNRHFNKLMSIVAVFVASTAYLSGCAPQGQGILGSNTPLSEIADQTTKAAPFAYDMAVDTISYNSCVSEGLLRGEIHGLKIGVNEGFADPATEAVNAGLKLRSDFLQYVGKNFKPDYPSDTITPTQVQNVLRSSDFNKGAYPQFAVRKVSDLTSIPDLIFPGQNNTKFTGVAGRDVEVIVKDLHAGYLGYSLTKGVVFTKSGSVLAEGPRTYNLSDTDEPYPIVASFGFGATEDISQPKVIDTAAAENFGAAEGYSESIRRRFNLSGSAKIILTATFGGADPIPDDTTDKLTQHLDRLKRVLKTDGTPADVTKAFGRGYQLKFTSKAQGRAGWVNNLLSEVKETDLATGSPGLPWNTCENYVIVRGDHWNNNKAGEPSCSPLISSDLTTDRQLRLKRIRRHYSNENWNVGLFLPAGVDATLGNRPGLSLCLAAKTESCYLPTTGILSTEAEKSRDVGIQYDSTKECYLTAFASLGQNYTTAATNDDKRKLGRCAQYASVCTRGSF